MWHGIRVFRCDEAHGVDQNFGSSVAFPVAPEVLLGEQWEDRMDFREVDFDQRWNDGGMRLLRALRHSLRRGCESLPFLTVNPNANIIVGLAATEICTRSWPVEEGGLGREIADETCSTAS